MFYHHTYCNRIAQTKAEELGRHCLWRGAKDLMASMAAILEGRRGAENAV